MCGGGWGRGRSAGCAGGVVRESYNCRHLTDLQENKRDMGLYSALLHTSKYLCEPHM